MAFCNAAVGVALLTQAANVDAEDKWLFRILLAIIATLGLILAYCLVNAERIKSLVIDSYLT